MKFIQGANEHNPNDFFAVILTSALVSHRLLDLDRGEIAKLVQFYAGDSDSASDLISRLEISGGEVVYEGHLTVTPDPKLLVQSYINLALLHLDAFLTEADVVWKLEDKEEYALSIEALQAFFKALVPVILDYDNELEIAQGTSSGEVVGGGQAASAILSAIFDKGGLLEKFYPDVDGEYFAKFRRGIEGTLSAFLYLKQVLSDQGGGEEVVLASVEEDNEGYDLKIISPKTNEVVAYVQVKAAAVKSPVIHKCKPGQSYSSAKAQIQLLFMRNLRNSVSDKSIRRANELIEAVEAGKIPGIWFVLISSDWYVTYESEDITDGI